ncbi:MAG: hypothetical protein GWN01_15630 [Nitrosopumilaceae archaeon]|nr:hypothetical protein [Nitrosopumilaceae archaeon]NIX62874.1 hypothetical protein [Nitrosopumilaceae archaeon]
MRFPKAGWTHKNVTSQVHLTNIAPTILDVLKIPNELEFDGRSLIPTLEENEEPIQKPAFASLYKNNRTLLGVIYKNFKLIWNSPHWIDGVERIPAQKEVYDLQNDPDENTNLINDSLQVAATLENFLDSLKQTKKSWRKKLNPQAKQKLKSLGYIK